MTRHFKKTLVESLSAVMIFGSMAFAQPTINQRQRNQQQRITHNEAVAKSDGNFTPQERAKIQRELNHSSRDIYRQKHDNQVQH